MCERVDIAKLFEDFREELLARLQTIRRHIDHPGEKGDASEFNWGELLRAFLPARYSVEKAFVIDADGHRSEQQDVVIFDRQYSPLIFKSGGVLYIPAESVYAVIESKQDISKKHLEYAAGKAESVRRLRRTSARIVHAGGEYKEPKQPFCILAGVAALSSDWNPPLGGPFEAAIATAAEHVDRRIDFGCVLDVGAFSVDYGDGESFKISCSRPEHSLMHFLLTLLGKLQRLGTVPALDVGEYARWLEAS